MDPKSNNNNKMIKKETMPLPSKKRAINPIIEEKDYSINTKTKQQTNFNSDSLNYFTVNYPGDNKKQQDLQILIGQANEKLKRYINNHNIVKSKPVVVQLHVVILKVGDIDNVNEKFQADAYIEACWEDDSIDSKSIFDPRHNWEPELFIENALGNLKQDISYKMIRRDGKVFVCEMRMIKGIFWEKLELYDFPLDIQDLTITVSTTRDHSEVIFVKSNHNESTINTNDFQQQQEWILYPNIYIAKRYIYDVWNKHERPCFSVSANIARRPGYYIYNAYMLIFLVSVLGFVPFSFAYDLPHFRIQTTCLLILSSVNFRWIVTQKLPTVSYLTTLDKYAIGALVFLALLCCWHGIIGASSDIFYLIEIDYWNKNKTISANCSASFKPKCTTFRTDVDKYAFFCIAILYAGFHLIYILFFLFKFCRYRKLNVVHSTEEEDELDRIQVAKYLSNRNDLSTGTQSKPISAREIKINSTKYEKLAESPSPILLTDPPNQLKSTTDFKRVNGFKINQMNTTKK